MSIFNDPTRYFVPAIKITGFVQREQTDEIGSVTLPYDPESLDIQLSNCVSSPTAIGDEAMNSHFSRSKPSELKVTFVLDDTTYSNLIAYLMPGQLQPMSVDKQIRTLKAVCCVNAKQENMLPYVAIKSLNMPLVDSASGVFHGLLTHLKVKNELVDALGNRVKARVECQFKYVAIAEKAGASALKKLTKMILVEAGKSLAKTAVKRYGSAASAAPLAAANGLNSVRKTKPGDVLESPPAQKIKQVADQAGREVEKGAAAARNKVG